MAQSRKYMRESMRFNTKSRLTNLFITGRTLYVQQSWSYLYAHKMPHKSWVKPNQAYIAYFGSYDGAKTEINSIFFYYVI